MAKMTVPDDPLVILAMLVLASIQLTTSTQQGAGPERTKKTVRLRRWF
jgi:hypothetical protein